MLAMFKLQLPASFLLIVLNQAKRSGRIPANPGYKKRLHRFELALWCSLRVGKLAHRLKRTRQACEDRAAKKLLMGARSLKILPAKTSCVQ